MDIQARKIHFVQEFLRLNNEQLISKFEQILQTEKQKLYAAEVKPMSLDTFNKMIDSAEDDAANGRFKSAQDLEKDIDSWT
jgi:FlaA1/EpsC-like NDP-sugar epimerase